MLLLPDFSSAPPSPAVPRLSAPRLVQVRDAGERQAVQALIRESFAREHQAQVRQFMPHLLALRDEGGQLLAAVGYRLAAQAPLFLERYLDAPIEQVLAARMHREVARSQIVEVGNLATARPGQARRLIAAMTALLAAQDLRWVAFTATQHLSNSFRRMNLATHVLASADPARLGDERADWGTYYDGAPHVLAGGIAEGLQRLAAQGRPPGAPTALPTRTKTHAGRH